MGSWGSRGPRHPLRSGCVGCQGPRSCPGGLGGGGKAGPLWEGRRGVGRLSRNSQENDATPTPGGQFPVLTPQRIRSGASGCLDQRSTLYQQSLATRLGFCAVFRPALT